MSPEKPVKHLAMERHFPPLFEITRLLVRFNHVASTTIALDRAFSPYGLNRLSPSEGLQVAV